MPTLNPSKIKTLSKAIAEAKKEKNGGALSLKSPEIIRMNRRLREAFGILVLPKNIPLPQFRSEEKNEATKLGVGKNIEGKEMPIAEEIKGRGFGLKNEDIKTSFGKSAESAPGQLAALEAERMKKAAEELERQKEAAKKAEGERTKQEKERQEAEEKIAADDLQKVLRILLAKLRTKKESLGKEAAALPDQKAPLEQKRRLLESKIAMVKNSELAMIEEKELAIEKKAASEKEALKNNPDPQKEKILKQKIWQTEDERKEIETQRWAVEDRIGKILAESQKIEAEIDGKNNLIKETEQKINDINGQEIMVRFAAEKIKAGEDILKIITEKEAVSPDFTAAENRKAKIQQELSLLSEEEALLSSRINTIENQEAKESDPAKKREIEQSRWEANNKLKSIVEKKWSEEEKFKQAETQLNSVKEKINLFNSKIDAIQNKIMAAQVNLEKDGLPVRALRDTIRRLLEENGVNFNPEILADIVQLEEEPAKKAAQQDKPEEKKIGQNKSEERKSEPENSKINQTPAQEIESQNKETAQSSPAQETKKSIQNNQNKDSGLPDNPAEKAPQTNIETPTGSQIKKTDIPETKKEEPKTGNEQETKNNIVAAKPAGETAKNAAPSAEDIAKMAARNGAIYREQVEASPAKNIRAFAQKDPLESSSKPNIQRPSAPPFEPVVAKKITEEPKQEEEILTPVAARLESRWQQIKKTTIPTNTGAINTSTMANEIAAVQPQPDFEQPMDKSGKNKFFARMMVILALAGILAITLIIIMSKNGNAPVVKKPATVETPAKSEPQTPAENKSILSAMPSPVTIYTDDPANIPNLISPYLRKKFDANGYYKLVIINRATDKKIGLKQFFAIYKINAPSVFYNSINDECEFFIFANNGKNRIGLVSPVINASLIETAMSGWEGSIVKDTENFFHLLGRKTSADNDALKFSTSGSAQTSYKLMSFSPAEDEFAIAWISYRQKYFVFSTSNNSMSGIFDRLPKE